MPRALGVAHVLSCRLRFTVKILYELCFLGFLCLTKQSKRAVHGAVLLAPASLQERFVGIILTVSKLFRYAPEGEYMCATGVRGARTLRCGENDYKVVLHRFPGAHLGPTILATTGKSKKNLKNIIDI